MATIGNWNGHTFEVSPALIRSFTDLTIKGGCETTDKNSEKQKYVERKYGEIPVLSLTVHLNAQTGVTDVYAEAMAYVAEATEGACAYFYLGSSKLLPAKMMLTDAEIVEIVTMPGKGNQWIACDVRLTLKQGGKNDGGGGSSGSGSGGGSKKASVKAKGTRTAVTGASNVNVIAQGLSGAKNQRRRAMEASVAAKLGGFKRTQSLIRMGAKTGMGATTEPGGMEKARNLVEKSTKTGRDTATKVSPTTSRQCEVTITKITRVPAKKTINTQVRK